jgi:uncharacterized protein YkwD
MSPAVTRTVPARHRFRRAARLAVPTLALTLLFAACTPEINRSQELVNQTRRANGRAELAINLELFFKAQGWADVLAREQRLRHSNLSDGITQRWRKLGENVGVGGNIDSVHSAFMNSAGHRANILDPAFNQLGVGVTRDGGGRYWIAQVYMQL